MRRERHRARDRDLNGRDLAFLESRGRDLRRQANAAFRADDPGEGFRLTREADAVAHFARWMDGERTCALRSSRSGDGEGSPDGQAGAEGHGLS